MGLHVDGKGNLKGKGIQMPNVSKAQVYLLVHILLKPMYWLGVIHFRRQAASKVRFVLVSNATEVLIFDVGGHTVETGYARSSSAQRKEIA